MNTYSVKLDTFEGPLDLLLHLINEAEVDIYDIPVANITEQYMTYVQSMQQLELDIASEYLVMAATLLMIKSKMLLPKYDEQLIDDEWEIEDDPRDELVEKLVEYKKYKEAAISFQQLEAERSLLYSRNPDDLTEYVSEEERMIVGVQNVTLLDMLGAYQRLLKRKKIQIPQMAKIQTEEYSVEDKMIDVLHTIEKLSGECHFADLFQTVEKGEIVVTFLAILELMKTKTIQCIQTTNFSDIKIFRRELLEVNEVGI